jgi:hypothetical protein
MTAQDSEFRLQLSRRKLLAAAGIGGGAVVAASLIGTGDAEAAPPARQSADPVATPPVAGLHLQFGADASSEMLVSWHTLQPVRNPRVVLERLDGKLEQTVEAKATSYTDAKSGQVVYAYHTKLGRLRADFDYLYGAMHDGAEPEFGTFRTSPRGRAPFTFTSFGDQGTPILGKKYVPPAGVLLPNPPYVNDNLGSPAAGDTTLGVERLQPLFHLFNGDLCYANLAEDRVRTWWDFWENKAAAPANVPGCPRPATTRMSWVMDRSGIAPIRPTSRCRNRWRPEGHSATCVGQRGRPGNRGVCDSGPTRDRPWQRRGGVSRA